MEKSSDAETVGFIDIGTNSIHLLVVRFYPGTSGAPIYQDKESVRLGMGLYADGRLDRGAIEKSALVVSRFASISRSLGASKVVAYATCAAREASNQQELLDAMPSDVEVRVIPGAEEARLIALGVFGDKGPEKRTVHMDIGGGSTEVVVREKGEDLFVDSLSMGAIRYDAGLGIDFTKAVSAEDYSFVMRTVEVSSYHAAKRIRTLGFAEASGSSGTLLSLADLCAAARGDKDASYVDLKELEALMPRLCSMDMEARAKVPGMSRSRADIIVPGGAIAQSLMAQFGIRRMRVSRNGLKQGMMIDHVLTNGQTVFSARESSVRALAHRCRYDQPHAKAVERNALALFDRTRELGMHSLDAQWRSLLACSAVLHDIGEIVSYSNHNAISQMMIENADLQGFTVPEIRDMGLIVRNHHKKFPGPKDQRYAGMPKDEVEAVRVCSILLKMADVMDRHRDRSIRGFTLTRSGGSVMLRLSADEDPSMEMWSLERIAPDFKKVFGCSLTVERDSPPGGTYPSDGRKAKA